MQAILEITDTYEDLRVIKLSAQALGNAATPRAWPAGSKEHKSKSLLNQFLTKFSYVYRDDGQIRRTCLTR